MTSASANGRPIVFDLFHTLVDPDDFRPKSFRRLEVAAAVLGVEFEILERAWDEALPELVRGRDSVRGLLRRVAHANGRPARTMDIAPAAEPLGRYQDLALLHPRHQVIELLEALAGRPIGMLSNCHDRDIEAWRQSPLASRIQHVAFSTKVHAAKPDPAAYDSIIRMMETTAGEVVFVGNGGDDELAGAVAVGIGSVVHFAALDDEYGRLEAAERARRRGQSHLAADSFAELGELLTGL